MSVFYVQNQCYHMSWSLTYINPTSSQTIFFSDTKITTSRFLLYSFSTDSRITNSPEAQQQSSNHYFFPNENYLQYFHNEVVRFFVGGGVFYVLFFENYKYKDTEVWRSGTQEGIKKDKIWRYKEKGMMTEWVNTMKKITDFHHSENRILRRINLKAMLKSEKEKARLLFWRVIFWLYLSLVSSMYTGTYNPWPHSAFPQDSFV